MLRDWTRGAEAASARRRPSAVRLRSSAVRSPPGGLPEARPLSAPPTCGESLPSSWRPARAHAGTQGLQSTPHSALPCCTQTDDIVDTFAAHSSERKHSRLRGDNSWYPVCKTPWYPADIRLICEISGCCNRSKHGCPQRFFNFFYWPLCTDIWLLFRYIQQVFFNIQLIYQIFNWNFVNFLLISVLCTSDIRLISLISWYPVYIFPARCHPLFPALWRIRTRKEGVISPPSQISFKRGGYVRVCQPTQACFVWSLCTPWSA